MLNCLVMGRDACGNRLTYTGGKGGMIYYPRRTFPREDELHLSFKG